MRAGMHVGTPRRLVDDYLGVDVNVAARVAGEASGDEFLVSGDALDALERGDVSTRKMLRYRAKGVPADGGMLADIRTIAVAHPLRRIGERARRRDGGS